MDRAECQRCADPAGYPLQGWRIKAIRVTWGSYRGPGGQSYLGWISGFAGNLEGQGVLSPFFAVLVIESCSGGGADLRYVHSLFAVPLTTNMRWRLSGCTSNGYFKDGG